MKGADPKRFKQKTGRPKKAKADEREQSARKNEELNKMMKAANKRIARLGRDVRADKTIRSAKRRTVRRESSSASVSSPKANGSLKLRS